jgi:hypothetical protein
MVKVCLGFLCLCILSVFSFAQDAEPDYRNTREVKLPSGGHGTASGPSLTEAAADREVNLLDNFALSKQNMPKVSSINSLPTEELKLIAGEVCKDPNFFLTQIGNEMVKKTDLTQNPVKIGKTFAIYQGAVPYYVFNKKISGNCNREDMLKDSKSFKNSLKGNSNNVNAAKSLRLLEKSRINENGEVLIYPRYDSTENKNNCSNHFEVDLDKSGRLIAYLNDSQGIKASVLCAENVKLGYAKGRNPPVKPSFTLPVEMPIPVDNTVTKNNSEK